jgi:hypothetical protein
MKFYLHNNNINISNSYINVYGLCNYEINNNFIIFKGKIVDYFNDNLKTIKAIKENLNPNGHGVIDFFNVRKVIENLVPYNEKTEKGLTFKQSRRLEEGYIFKDIHFEDDGNRYHFTERVQALTLTDFQDYFDQAGLQLEHVYGSYQLENFDAATSDRLIMIFKPAKD